MIKKILTIIFFLNFFVTSNIYSQEKLAFIDINYIFNNSEENIAHIPEKSRGVLGRINSDLARKIKSYLLEVLS